MSRLFIVIFLFSFNMIQAQSYNDLKNEADYYLLQKKYYSAIFLYQKALNKKESNIDLKYNYAETLRHTYRYKEALKYYKEVYNINSDYKNVKLWIGVLYKNISSHNLSISFLNEYILSNPLDEILYKKALIELEANKFIKSYKKDSFIVVDRLIGDINSEFSEISPYYYNHNLYYASIQPNNTNDYKSSIFSALFTNDTLYSSQEFNLINDSKMHISNLFFDSLSQRFFFNKCNMIENEFICHLYYADIENLNHHIYISDINISNFSSTQPIITKWNGVNILIFSSDRYNGYGENDIWYSVIENNLFSEPINFGSEINSPGNEVSPYYDIKENNLYFSSDWYMGFGGYDVFKIHWNGFNWEKIINMGGEINSSYNDLYLKFSYTKNYKFGFFASNRKESLNIIDEFCCNDIYKFKIINNCDCDTIKPSSFRLNKLLPLKIYFDNDKPKKSYNDILSSEDYKFYYNNYLNKKNEFIYIYSSNLDGDFKTNAINNMNYFFDTEVIQGKINLDNLLVEVENLLKENKKIKLIFKGFASPLTSNEYNKKLSKRRINSVEKYIKNYNQGILKEYFINNRIQIVMMPFGEDLAPKFINDNPKDIKNSIFGINASRERRVEIIKIEID